MNEWIQFNSVFLGDCLKKFQKFSTIVFNFTFQMTIQFELHARCARKNSTDRKLTWNLMCLCSTLCVCVCLIKFFVLVICVCMVSQLWDRIVIDSGNCEGHFMPLCVRAICLDYKLGNINLISDQIRFFSRLQFSASWSNKKNAW